MSVGDCGAVPKVTHLLGSGAWCHTKVAVAFQWCGGSSAMGGWSHWLLVSTTHIMRADSQSTAGAEMTLKKPKFSLSAKEILLH